MDDNSGPMRACDATGTSVPDGPGGAKSSSSCQVTTVQGSASQTGVLVPRRRLSLKGKSRASGMARHQGSFITIQVNLESVDGLLSDFARRGPMMHRPCPTSFAITDPYQYDITDSK